MTRFFWIGAFLLLFTSCATIVPPSGGDKDITPPELTSSNPLEESVQFKGQKIILSFNEYVTIKQPKQEILISPPIKKFPEITTKQKSVIITFQEPLLENTTYSINFGNAITDITENNISSNYIFSFATGPTIDSFALGGRVIDAFSLLPVSNAVILLFGEQDTIGFTPNYIAKSNSSGYFLCKNITSQPYQLMALQEKNNSLTFDISTEKVGFSKAPVTPIYLSKTDSIKSPLPNLTTITLFQEKETTQKVLSARLTDKYKGIIILKSPITAPAVTLNNGATSLLSPFPIEKNRLGDTLTVWLPKREQLDTLTYTLWQNNTAIDTLKFTKPLGKAQQKEKQKMTYTTNLRKPSILSYFSPLLITFSQPIDSFNLSDITLSQQIDSTQKIRLIPQINWIDSIHRTVKITYPWAKNTSYTLDVLPAKIKDSYGLYNDTISCSFITDNEENYGKLMLKLTNTDTLSQAIIIQLRKKDKVVYDYFVTKDHPLVFEQLLPDTYTLLLISDKNNNKEWDSGLFKEKIQPESVHYYKSNIQVRANWDMELDWEIK